MIATTQLELLKNYSDFIPIKELKNCLILGDYSKILPLIPDNTFKTIIIDPPYNISQQRIFRRDDAQDLSLNFGSWDRFGKDEEGNRKFLDYIFRLCDECYRVLSEDGTLFLFCTDTHNSFINYYLKYNLKMNFKATYIWVKLNPPPRFLKKSFAWATEFCLIAQKNKKATFNFLNQKEMKNYYISGLVSGKERLKNKKGKTLHPTQKPEGLIKKFILISSNEKDLIGDFMAGTFTTCAVAKKLSRNFFGIEKKYRYFKYGVDRVKKAHILSTKKQKLVLDFVK